jgi:hypothetical protein
MGDDEMSDEEISAGLRALSEAEFEELVARLAVVEAPRMFAVYEVAPDRSDVVAFGWGLAFATRAFFVGCRDARPTYASLGSPAALLRLFGRRRDLRLHWPVPDPDRAELAGWPADEELAAAVPGG